MDDVRWLSDEEGEVWRRYLYATQLLLRTLDRQLQHDSGLTHSQYGILVRLTELPGRSSRITELASLMEHSQSRMSHAVASLVRAGFVRRETDSADGRVVRAVLTETGEEALAVAAPGHVRCVRENLFDGLDPAQLHQLRDICGIMIDRLVAPATTSDRPALARSRSGAVARSSEQDQQRHTQVVDDVDDDAGPDRPAAAQ